jgi:putative endonuclease
MPGRRYYFVYLLANSSRSVMYAGVTRNLLKRVLQHRAGLGSAFVKKYWIHNLVWYEVHESPVSAITREKQIKAGSRARKIALVESTNAMWRDLSEEI